MSFFTVWATRIQYLSKCGWRNQMISSLYRSGTPVSFLAWTGFFYSAIDTIHFFIWIKPSSWSSFIIFFTSLCGNSSSISFIFNTQCFTNCFIVRQRTCLSDHSNLDCLESGFIFVFLAVKSNAHWSMSALCRSREHPGGIILVAKSSSSLAVIVSGSLNKNINTLLIFVSITGTGKFRANAIIAAEV